MGNYKIPHLVQQPNGGFYYQATPKMRRSGIFSEPLGKDFAAAAARAEELNAAWQAIRTGQERVLTVAPSPEGTMARLIEDLLASQRFLDRSIARQDEIKYSLKLIEPVFSPSRLKAISADHCEQFYRTLRLTGSVHKAQRVMKDLRFLLNRATKRGMIRFNPALAFEVAKPKPRTVTWEEWQISKLIKTAFDMDFGAIVVAVAMAYDTGLSPVDVRIRTVGEVSTGRFAVERTKSGVTQYCELSDETRNLIKWYHNSLGVELLPTSFLIRTRRGRPYTKNRLGEDFREVRREAGLPEELKLADLRRTANTEANNAGATISELAAKFEWSHEYIARMQDVYNQTSFEQAHNAETKRCEYKKGTKV